MKRIYGLVTATLLVLLVFATSKTRAEGYGLNIAGVSVTSGNCNKLNTIDGVRGELKYDHASKTLTLKNVKITPPKGKIAIENTGVQNLKIDVSGNNELSANNADGLSFGASATITGYGKLTVRTGDYHSAVYVRKDVTLTIENTTLDAEGRNGIFGQDGGNGTVVIRQATVSAKGGYGYAITDLADLKLDDCRFASPDGIFWNSWYKAVVYPGGNRKVVELKIEPNYGFSIAGVMITPENYNKLNKIDGVRGELKYDRASKILTLENVKITPPKGKIAIENTDAVGLKIVVSGNNELTTNNADGIAFRASATITGEGELRVKTEGNNCAVYVRGEEVTLTVENTTLFAEGNNGILGHKNFFTYGKLIVRNAMVNAKGRDGHAIIDLDEFRLEKSSFVLPEGGAWDANQHAVMAGSAKAKEVRIEPNYGLYIAGVAVTSKNCNKLNTIEGVRGELKYDPAKKLLTMKDAKITPPEGKIAIENVELLDLKIDVLGNNEFIVSRADGLSFGASATITGKGKLTVKTGWNHAAVYVRKGATLTVENTTIDIEGENGFFGQDGRNGILVIRNATVSAKTIHEGYAITDLKVLNLDKAHIVHPEAGEWHYPGHVVTNGGDLNQKATFVKIEPFYEFHIAEKAITSGNVDKLDKIYGVTVPTDGMLKYNTATRTLTMKNVKITPRFKKNAIVSVGTSDLKIEVLGTNEITTDWADALSFGTSATITGEGTLTVKTAGDNAAIYVRKGSTLTVENITLAAEGKNGILGQDGHNGKLVVRSATVDAKGREGYAISDLQDFRLEKSQIVEPKGGEWNADRHAVMDGGAKAKVVKIRVLVTGVTLDKTTLTFTIGDAAQTLTATVAPANATNKKVTWTSNKTDVATVDENGKVTAVGVGEATITVTTEDGGKTAACTVKVNAKPDTPTAVTGVTLDKATLTFTIGDAAQTLTATVAPENATNKKVTWTSSNAKVATVANGTVTAVGVGEATITVTTEDGGKTAACWVKVKAKPADTPKPTPEAVEDVILARLEVSPNPFSTQLRIVNPEGIAVSYELVNLMGLVLRRGVFAGSDTMVDTTDLPTGLYFVRLTGENGAKRVLRVFHY